LISLSLLLDCDAHTQKEACWLLSNILSNELSLIDIILIAHITWLMDKDPVVDVRKEAFWAIATASWIPELIADLTGINIVVRLCTVLAARGPDVDVEALLLALAAVDQLLSKYPMDRDTLGACDTLCHTATSLHDDKQALREGTSRGHHPSLEEEKG
jgi:hypothetical protein